MIESCFFTVNCFFAHPLLRICTSAPVSCGTCRKACLRMWLLCAPPAACCVSQTISGRPVLSHRCPLHHGVALKATEHICRRCQREITEDAVHGRPEKQQPLPEQPGSVAVDIPAPAATQQGSGGAGPAAPPGSQPPAVGGQGGAACTCGAAQQPPGSAAPAAGLPV